MHQLSQLLEVRDVLLVHSHRLQLGHDHFKLLASLEIFGQNVLNVVQLIVIQIPYNDLPFL